MRDVPNEIIYLDDYAYLAEQLHALAVDKVEDQSLDKNRPLCK